MKNEESFSGSTFFAANDPSPLQSSYERNFNTSPLKSNGRVAIFSDESDLRILLKTLLKIWNYQTMEFAYSENLPSLIKCLNPDLILLDSAPPFENGLKFIRRIRRGGFGASIPIIILSGFSQTKFRRLSLSAGATDFFVKPLDFDLLEKSIRENISKSNQRENL